MSARVGWANAVDETAGEPVTNFTHSSYLYRTAMRYNRGLDRDHDGIACEKL
jgi:Excalibur calcium-binding domain